MIVNLFLLFMQQEFSHIFYLNLFPFFLIQHKILYLLTPVIMVLWQEFL